ncbi:MAG: ABC transporter permease subunit [Halobacteriaceae archaeon]
MGVRTVFYDDLRNTSRSAIVVGVIGLLAAFVALIVFAVAEFHTDAFRALFDVSFFVFLVFPLALAPLTYLAIAGDIERGSIKYALGLPNTRAAYLSGKVLARSVVGILAVLVATVVATLLGAVLYDGMPAVERFVAFGAVTAVFVVSLTTIFVAASALARTRSRAMFGVIALYFALGPFWFGLLPVANLEAVLELLTNAVGTSLSERTYSHIRFSSPTTAYLSALEIVYDGVIETGEYPRITRTYTQGTGELYAKTWYNIATMVVWAGVALLLSYARFRRAELA